jgi:hypothetical protein
MSKEVED